MSKPVDFDAVRAQEAEKTRKVFDRWAWGGLAVYAFMAALVVGGMAWAFRAPAGPPQTQCRIPGCACDSCPDCDCNFKAGE